MAPVLGVASARPTYQRLCSLLRALRQAGGACRPPHNAHHTHTPQGSRHACFSVLRTRLAPAPPLPLAVYRAAPRPRHPARLLHGLAVLRQKDVPDYLIGSISQIDTAEDDLLGAGLEGEGEAADMEDDIMDFLNPRLVPLEETDTSFVIPCPICVQKAEDETKMQEIFVDKNSGYFVCPWCCRDGSWEELMSLLDTREDTLTHDQLASYLHTATAPMADAHDDLLKESPLKGTDRVTLERFGARVTTDEARVVFPVTDVAGELVGLESVSLLHHLPQIIRRYIVGRSSVFAPPSTTSTSTTSSTTRRVRERAKAVVVVPSCCDVLTLSQLGIYALSLPSDGYAEAVEAHLGACEASEVWLWCRGVPPPRSTLLCLIHTGLSVSLVESSEHDTPVYLKSEGEVRTALQRTIPVLSPATTTFAQLKEKVYYRITHRQETCGVQWKRFAALNDLLLGHRSGEVTVLTGPTGSGKTTLMAEYSLDLCGQGVRTLWGSFEISVVRLCEVMLQQYSGAALPQQLHAFNTLAAQFSSLPLHFLTYHGQHSVESVVKAMREAVQVWGVQHAIIDNLQFMLGSGSSNSGDRWWEQDKAVATLRRFATQTGCHVTVIAHPKKVPDGQPLGIGSVFGSAKITQEADNVLILQVKEGSSALTPSRKVLQVVKNRYGGQLGDLPLKFHKDSLTLSSCFRQKVKGRSGQSDIPSLRRMKVRGLTAIDT